MQANPDMDTEVVLAVFHSWQNQWLMAVFFSQVFYFSFSFRLVN